MKAKIAAPITTLFSITILGALAISCGSTPSPEALPTDTPGTTTKPSPISEDVHPESDDLGTVPDRPLSDEGPWWVFSTPDGLSAINPDGSGLKQFYFSEMVQPYLDLLPAASGGHVAYLTGTGISDLTLRFHHFPGPESVAEIPLTSGLAESGEDAMPGDPAFEAFRAMTEITSMAFSPDGRHLAFMGAIDGPTSDLYLYSFENRETTRLTSGPSQAFQPVWSPDGKYIVHAGARTFGTGAGYSMEGVWAAAADDSGVVTLYNPSGSGSEEIVGWVDDRTFVVHSWNASCGPNSLRTHNIETGKIDVLWPEFFSAVAFDPENAVAVIGIRFEDCNADGQAGLFRVPTDGGAPVRIVEDRPSQIIWSPEAGLFLAKTEFGTLAIDSTGQFIDLEEPPGASAFPAVAPGSRDLAWPGDGLWVGPLLGSIDQPPQKIFDAPVSIAVWDPSGNWVIFFSEGGLYAAQSPDFAPLLVAEGPDKANGLSGWVYP